MKNLLAKRQTAFPLRSAEMEKFLQHRMGKRTLAPLPVPKVRKVLTNVDKLAERFMQA